MWYVVLRSKQRHVVAFANIGFSQERLILVYLQIIIVMLFLLPLLKILCSLYLCLYISTWTDHKTRRLVATSFDSLRYFRHMYRFFLFHLLIKKPSFVRKKTKQNFSIYVFNFSSNALIIEDWSFGFWDLWLRHYFIIFLKPKHSVREFWKKNLFPSSRIMDSSKTTKFHNSVTCDIFEFITIPSVHSAFLIFYPSLNCFFLISL